jgi:hypothetical protein
MSLEHILIAILIILLFTALWFLHLRLREETDDASIIITPIATRALITMRQDNIELPPPTFPLRMPRRPTPTPPVKTLDEANKYYTSMEKHDDNPQNTHDHQILKYLSRKWRRLLQLAPKVEIDPALGMTRAEFRRAQISATFQEIRRELELYAAKAKRTQLFKDRIDMVLIEMAKGQTTISISRQNRPTREDVVLTEVWRRINHPDNKEKRDSMVIALLDQLHSCTEKKGEAINALVRMVAPEMQIFDREDPERDRAEDYNILCINGRVDRVLCALTLQDVDPILSEPEKDSAELANTAYMKSYKIIQDIQQNWPQKEGQRPFLEVINMVESNLTEAEKATVKEYQETAKKQIERVLTEEYKDLVDPSELKNIITKAQAGVA